MAVFGRLAWVETKLFIREPFALFFALAFPLIILVIMAAVFSMTPYAGAPNSTTYYAGAALGMVVAAVAFVGVPVELAAYRERGVLRRFRASGISVWAIFGSQLAVACVITVLGAAILWLAGSLDGRMAAPTDPVSVAAGVLVAVFGLVGVGLVLGALLPNARVAQGVGLLVFFAGYLLSGGGPPREAMPDTMLAVSDVDPVTRAIAAIHGPWFLGASTGPDLLVLLAMGGIGLVVAALVFRWD